MPALDFSDLQEDGGSWPDNDECTVTVESQGKRYVFKPRFQARLADDSQVGADTRPRSFLLNQLAAQFEVDDQAKVVEVFEEMLDDDETDEATLTKLMEWISDEREKARKALSKKKLKRPTGAPSDSGS